MGNTVPYKYETVKAVKEMILAILAKESLQYSTDKFNFSQVLWSFKIYNSSVEINSKTGRVFQPLETSSIEGFEKQLDSYLDLGCVSALKSEPGVNLAELLSTSLKSVLSDLPWPEPRNGNEFGAGMSGGFIFVLLFLFLYCSVIERFFELNYFSSRQSAQCHLRDIPRPWD
jgi:hypothetical protein